ncbi:MAG TPA: hypothetical protein VF902_10540, partial [Coriobacteriia bacterium]
DATDVSSIPGLPGPGAADIVFLDAPCSGLGTLRRRSDRRWRLRLEDLVALVRLQREMLEQAASLVRPGGIVVYSTCSVARRENHDVVAAFVTGPSGRRFRTVEPAGAVPETWRRWVGPEGWFQSVPEAAGPDGHFAAVLLCEG